MTSNAPATAPSALGTAPRIRIDFLFLDLRTCSRCVGTDQNLDAALETVRQVVEATGGTVEVYKTLVESEEQARRLRFVASPTIRVNGRDIALGLKESSCGSEACTDGCGDHINCRMWTHHGRDYTQAPVGLIVDAVLGEMYGGRAQPTLVDEPYEVPENLQRFFAGRSAAVSTGQAGCCAPSEQESCCEPAAKESCCQASTTEGCGCK
ncbi:MAG: DUF2703 domain-containing protein [Egibacteraceae bacterium]